MKWLAKYQNALNKDILVLCSEQPDLVKDAPAHCRGLGLDDL